MDTDFKKLGCYAKKVVIDKVNDEVLKIYVEDAHGDEHHLEVGVIIENFQNIDTFGDKDGHMIDIPMLDMNYSVNKSEKLSSKNISMKWNHNNKPSVFEVRNKDDIVFSGTYSDAIEWVRKNVTECNQNIVKKKSLH